jgi:4-amino-4-deoxy-L-arabinose transferase-like glycosyltransferase
MSFAAGSPLSNATSLQRDWPRAGLLVVLVVAGLLRAADLTRVPPGLSQDEAANAWNAYCLLKTGCDQFGVHWPIFYMRALGENRSTLFAYFMLPFQAIGGLNVWTTRLPAVVAGVLSVLLMYWVGTRLCGPRIGLLAAVLLAINPTDIQLTRWGHEASLTPVLTLLPIAALLWAGFSLGDDPPRAHPWRALLAGLLTGICCYGYPAARLYVPVFLTTCLVVTNGAWRSLLRVRRGLASIAALAIGVAVTFGPLAYVHITQPEQIGRRGQTTWIWASTDPPLTRAEKVLDRYGEHFGRDFLYRYGDVYDVPWSHGFGFVPGYLLPCLAAGVVACVPQWRRSRAARVLLVALVLYPAGDCLNWHYTPNSLRSSAGLWGLILLAAFGIHRTLAFLTRHRLTATALALGVTLVGAVVAQEARFLHYYFAKRPTEWQVYYGNHADLIAACDWLRPRLADVDAVICTAVDFNQPYLIPLVALSYDPRQWFAEPREWHPEGEWDRWVRYGEFFFVYEAERPPILDQLKADGQPKRVVLILRSNEPAPGGEPVHQVVGPDGKIALVIYDVHL